jgi:hypothetical protein
MAATGLLDSFIIEAGNNLARLDVLVARAGLGAPSTAELLTEARALRAAATLAKQEAIATVAAGLVRLTKALHEQQLQWDAARRGTTISTIDDLKILVRHVRTWSADDDVRATRRADELAALVPAVGSGVTQRADRGVDADAAARERVVPIEALAPDEPAGDLPQTGAALHALLSSGIAGLTGLDAEPFSPPAVVEEELVGIDELLYRGRAALDRAIAVRDAIRASQAPAPADQLEELFALLDLARTD